MKWKIVPVKLTPAMEMAMYNNSSMEGGEEDDCWYACVTAAPNPLDDAELVERVARAIYKTGFPDRVWENVGDTGYWMVHARAAIAAMMGGE